MSLRVQSGNVTVALDGALERFVAGLLETTQDETVKRLRAEAEDLAGQARAAWYGPSGVTRETGLSGDIRVQTTIDIGRGEIRCSIGSTDKRITNGKPLPVYVHRPSRTSTILRAVTPREYFAAPKIMRGPWLPGPKRIPQIYVPNPAASDGKFLLQTFIRAPGRALAKRVAAALGAQLVARARHGR